MSAPDPSGRGQLGSDEEDSPLIVSAALHGARNGTKGQEWRSGHRKPLWALTVVTTGFFFTFAGYTTCENLNVALHGDAGFYSLVAVYGAVLPGALVGPAVLAKIGPRASMFGGAIPYLLFGVANVALEIESGNTESGVNDRFTLICFMAAGAGVGLGCGILWGAQGVYITEQAAEYDRTREVAARQAGKAVDARGSLGLFTGIGGSASSMGGVVAMSGSSLLLGLNLVSRQQLYLVLVGLLTSGLACFILLPARPTVAITATHAAAESPLAAMAAVPALIRNNSIHRMLMVCFLSAGYASGFMSGSFTSEAVGLEMGIEWIGFVMAVRNCFGIVSGVVIGRLSDQIGRFKCYVLTLLVEGITATTLSIVPMVEGGGRLTLLLGLAGCMGVGNVGSYTILRASLGDHARDPSELSAAFAASKFTESFGQMTSFLLGPLLSLQAKAWLLLILWVSACVSAVLGLGRSQQQSAVP